MAVEDLGDGVGVWSPPSAPTGPIQVRYGVKSGIVSMARTTGTPMRWTLYFDDFGAKRALVTEMDIEGIGHVENVAIDADGYRTTYSAGEKRGGRRKVVASTPPFDAVGKPPLDCENLPDDVKRKMNAQPIPARSVAGKDAEGFELDGPNGFSFKCWTWKGILLREEAFLGALEEYEVSSLEADVPIPASRFEPPPDVQIHDVEAH